MSIFSTKSELIIRKRQLFYNCLLLVGFLLVIFLLEKTNVVAEAGPSVRYSVHVENIGWMSEQSDGEVAGTSGRALRMEAMKAHITGDSNLGICYQGHVQNIGWQDWSAGGTITGTSGKALRMEAIKIRLTGRDASMYDVYYCAHVQNFGWLNWAKNGEIAGSTGYGYRLEALRIALLPKGSKAPANIGSNPNSVASTGGTNGLGQVPSICYQGHFSNLGWTGEKADGQIDGEDGGSRLEGLEVWLENAGDSGIQYKAYVENQGWQDWVYNGTLSGTVGKALHIEAVSMKLYGPLASQYDLYYCAYVSDVGWLNWAKNGVIAGSTGEGISIRSFRVLLAPKGSGQPANGGTISSSVLGAGPGIYYQAYVANAGWERPTNDGNTSGDAGSGNPMTAVKIDSDDSAVLLNYSTFVEGSGWQTAVQSGMVSGTSGSSRALQAIKINITGESANLYDVYYRTYLRYYGWLNWAKDGELSGSDTLGYPIEGLQIILKIKGTPLYSGSGISLPGIHGDLVHLSYSSHVQNIGWQAAVSEGMESGTNGRGLRMEAIRISKAQSQLGGSIQYRAHVENVGWQNWQSDGAIAGTSGRALRIEALGIRLTGQMEKIYDIYYRCHIQNKGWTGWTKNGANCGSQGLALRMEAIQIVLRYKGQVAPGELINSFYLPLKSGNGIDLSAYQGNVNWPEVSKHVNFAIIRANSHKNGVWGQDKKFKENMYGAKVNQVQVGVYCYSLAKTKAEAIEEARKTIAMVQKAGGTDYPIFIDQEDVSLNGLSNAERTEIIQAFVDTVNDAGYLAGVYSSYYWLKGKVDLSSIHNAYLWVAHTTASDRPIPHASMWQYSHTGSVPGINGNVDLDRSYF